MPKHDVCPPLVASVLSPVLSLLQAPLACNPVQPLVLSSMTLAPLTPRCSMKHSQTRPVPLTAVTLPTPCSSLMYAKPLTPLVMLLLLTHPLTPRKGPLGALPPTLSWRSRLPTPIPTQ